MSHITKTFFVFNQIANFFCRITEKKLYVYDGPRTGPIGLPYEEMVQKVNETYTACHAVLAEPPFHWPASQQIAAMNQSLRWGDAGNGEHSLQIDFAQQFSNSSFINCFSKSITEWADEYQQSLNTGLVTTFSLIVGLAAIGLGLYATYRFYQCYQANRSQSNYDVIKDSLFAPSFQNSEGGTEEESKSFFSLQSREENRALKNSV